MNSFPADNCFGSCDFTEDSSLSYTGTGPGLDQTFFYRYHDPGCRNTCPVDECYYCSGYMRNLSPTPPAQYPQPIPVIQERSPTPGRTYAQAAAQALGTSQVTSPAALAAARQLRPQLPQQARVQSTVPRPAAPSAPSRPNAAQLAQQRSYAQAARQARNIPPTRRQTPSAYGAQGNVQQSSAMAAAQQLRASAPVQGLYQGQLNLSVNYSGGQTHLGTPMYPAAPQQQPMPAQNMLQIPMGNFANILRPEYTDNPRNIDNLVEGTQRGSHRQPMSTHSSGNSTPASPGAMSVRSGSSHQSRRTGSALRDPNLPHHCPRCGATFAKFDDLRRHGTRTHSEVWERPHHCSEPGCPWAFVHPKDLRRHEKSHQANATVNPERFYCQFEDCTRSYTRSDNLQRHMNKDHYVDSGLGYSPSMSRTTSQSSYHAQPYRN
ncbi:hypothetical protein M409DRAFT_57082 [Zasmidium cellare ATCC 36951]|uniref:C2H2 type master regulator of conidiophore development brlA n=1 Tax=Zasmidium cellare ATCC 36951 TaxID=1080233 RepID=A0A6A6CCN0_ZASCE|nr:uncharacterized protein M409DRAFT_57082 [Zasmidium cellare ATCC 36951]KAF2163980.1 hypothetical protein M409DRAFT_57082 [Zasmidium cellare ATCC 36951]